MKPAFLARTDPDLIAAWEWFQFQSALLAEAGVYVLSLPAPSGGQTRPYAAHFALMTPAEFALMTPAEVDEFFQGQQGELEMLTMFALLATVEAALRLDFEDRIGKRKKDPVARKFRSFRQSSIRTRLDEEILETWEIDAGVKVSGFRGALRLRHWLAHGRYWRPNLGQQFHVADIYRICTDLLDSVALAGAAL